MSQFITPAKKTFFRGYTLKFHTVNLESSTQAIIRHENQLGQLATTIAKREKGKLPS